MAANSPTISQRKLFSWIFKRYPGLQLVLLILIFIMVFARVLPLEMQKRIVNIAIGSKNVHALYFYCAYYLAAVVSAGVLKYFSNLLQNYIGQKILLEVRRKLYEHIIRLPLPFFRRTPPGMVISSLTSELSVVGTFLGGALAIPLINILTLFTFAGYLIHLNPLLALVSFSIYPLEILIIPFLQNRYNRLNKDRVDTTRTLSNTIGEVVSGIHEVHGNGSYSIEKQRFAHFAQSLFRLRYRMDIVKFGIKFVNNFFQSLGPFILFLLGGYLTIHGHLDLGVLVAFLSAYEKLYDPWKELMDYYQSLQDARVRYYRVMNYFDEKPEFALESLTRKPLTFSGRITLQNVLRTLGKDIRLLDQISLNLEPGGQLALVGFSGSGKSTLARVMAQICNYDKGQVKIDGEELKTLTKRDVVRNIGFVAQHPFVFNGTLLENLVYGCEALKKPADGSWEKETSLHETESLDKTSMTCEKEKPDRKTIIETITKVGLFDDVLHFGLNSVLHEDRNADLIPKLIHVRNLLLEKEKGNLGDWVEFFEANRYMYHADLFCNLTFGSPNREKYQRENLPDNPNFRIFLRENDLTLPLLELGEELARQTVTLLAELQGDAFFFENSPISEEEFLSYQELVERLERRKLFELPPSQRDALIHLALRFIPSKHKMAAFPKSLETMILKGRTRLMEKMNLIDPNGFTFYNPSNYLPHQSIMGNILFGNLKSDHFDVREQIQECIIRLLNHADLMDDIVEIGLQFKVGSNGDRLSGGQKQKTALARALLKNPSILILDEATSGLDNASQARIQNLLETEYKGKCTLIAVAHRLDTIRQFDQIAVMKTGKIIEMGSYGELMSRKGIFYELVHKS